MRYSENQKNALMVLMGGKKASAKELGLGLPLLKSLMKPRLVKHTYKPHPRNTGDAGRNHEREELIWELTITGEKAAKQIALGRQQLQQHTERLAELRGASNP